MSLSTNVMAGEYPPGEIIVAPDASFAVTVTGVVIALPAYGDVFAMEMATEATMPSRVMGTAVGVAVMEALTLPLASGEPVAFVPEYSTTLNVSEPVGAFTDTVHVVVPPEVLQPFDVGVRFWVTDGGAPLTAIVNDCVFGETYLGAEAVVFAGTAMEKTAFDVCCGPCAGAGTAEPPPPPPQAVSANIDAASSARFSSTLNPPTSSGPLA